MWLMTTKGRPAAAEQVLGECWDKGMRQRAIMYVDGNAEGYDFTRPDNWGVFYGNGNLAGSKRWILENFPDEDCYGWLADDNHPVTMHFSDYIEEVARPWKLVHCRDDFVSEMDYKNQKILHVTGNLGGGLCWGGDLIRSVGWWSPPGITQASIDWTWTTLCKDTPLGVYLHNIKVRHDNHATGRRSKDATDEWGPHMEPDIATIKRFRLSQDFHDMKVRVLREYTDYCRGIQS